MGSSFIEVRELKKSFHGNPVLCGVNLSVEQNQLTVVIGPSGCGKSTLLRCLNGLEGFDEGELTIDGINLRGDSNQHQVTHRLRGLMGMVFQAFNLFPHMTALENVARPPMIVQGVSSTEAHSNARRLLEKVGLGGQAALYPAQPVSHLVLVAVSAEMNAVDRKFPFIETFKSIKAAKQR